MSAFGDNTPTQEIYDVVSYLMNQQGFSAQQIIIMLANIILYIGEE
jgi:hypothetical protein